jgi:hypothetical protein
MNDTLSGFPHGGVTPLGMKYNVPVVIDKKIIDLCSNFPSSDARSVFWLGAGLANVPILFPFLFLTIIKILEKFLF